MTDKEEKFDVVVKALTEFRDRLLAMTERNMNSASFNVMDQIRLQQIDELDDAIEERKNKDA